MSFEYAIEVNNLGKCYQIYDKPSDRLKQMLFRGRRQYYKEFWALKDVSFKVGKGETVGIIGRNGSGKSTLLQMICGTLNPTSGEIKVNGRVAALLELGAGFNPEFTGVENVYMAASLYGLAKEEVEQRFKEIATFADIGDYIYQPVKTYSSGMYVRLAFAVIAHVDAEILVIDEALAVGDAFFTQKCMRFLRNFIQTGTVLFVSHDTSTIRSLCHKAIWIDRGYILKEGPPKEVSDSYLEAFYESYHGLSVTSQQKSEIVNDGNVNEKDQRHTFFNSTNLRNDIQLFHFDINSPSFGKGGARIVSVKFTGSDGSPLSWIVGGEEVTLNVRVLAFSKLDSPIVGFFIKDKTGQCLFGDNTWLSYIDSPIVCKDGEYLNAKFTFNMPRLATGDYSVTVAVANGNQYEHVQHQWIHDAIVFRSESTSVASGIVGIPIKKIRLDLEAVSGLPE